MKYFFIHQNNQGYEIRCVTYKNLNILVLFISFPHISVLSPKYSINLYFYFCLYNNLYTNKNRSPSLEVDANSTKVSFLHSKVRDWTGSQF